jgi:membrane protease YdiL (CAAX protease family)
MAVLLSGALFGLYHLQLTNILPLALLGVAMGAITVATGSIIPAMVAHFINNAGAVLLVRFAPDSPMVQMGTETPPSLLYIIVSVTGTLILGRMFLNHYKRAQSHAII